MLQESDGESSVFRTVFVTLMAALGIAVPTEKVSPSAAYINRELVKPF